MQKIVSLILNNKAKNLTEHQLGKLVHDTLFNIFSNKYQGKIQLTLSSLKQGRISLLVSIPGRQDEVIYKDNVNVVNQLDLGQQKHLFHDVRLNYELLTRLLALKEEQEQLISEIESLSDKNRKVITKLQLPKNTQLTDLQIIKLIRPIVDMMLKTQLESEGLIDFSFDTATSECVVKFSYNEQHCCLYRGYVSSTRKMSDKMRKDTIYRMDITQELLKKIEEMNRQVYELEQQVLFLSPYETSSGKSNGSPVVTKTRIRALQRLTRLGHHVLPSVKNHPKAGSKENVLVEHRAKRALISEIINKLRDLGVQGIERKELDRIPFFILRELIRLNIDSLKSFFTDQDWTKNVNNFQNIGTTSEHEDRGNYLKILSKRYNFKKYQLDMLRDERRITDKAIEVLFLLPTYVQKDLLDKFFNENDFQWHGSFVRGYYFLHIQLNRTEKGKFVMNDITLQTKMHDRERVIFWETICSAFGKFVNIEERENKIFVEYTPGLDVMAKKIAQAGDHGGILGVFGEIMTAYYLELAHEIEVIGFNYGFSNGEIDFLAIDGEGYLLDVEIKNWVLRTDKSARSLMAHIYNQFLREGRRQILEEKITEIEKITGKKIKGVKHLAVIAQHTPFQDYILRRHEDLRRENKVPDNFEFLVVDLMPRWLAKGVYKPAVVRKRSKEY